MEGSEEEKVQKINPKRRCISKVMMSERQCGAPCTSVPLKTSPGEMRSAWSIELDRLRPTDCSVRSWALWPVSFFANQGCLPSCMECSDTSLQIMFSVIKETHLQTV